MSVDNRLMIKNLMNQQELILAYCRTTNMPFIVCDPESFNDQVWIFTTVEELQAFGKPYAEKKIPLVGMKYPQERFQAMFTGLYHIGVNSVVFVNGETKEEFELSELAKEPDFSQLKPQDRPVLNPLLQLAGLYFCQEAYRPVPNEEKPGLKELEEELAVNLTRSRFVGGIELVEGPGTDVEKLQKRQYRLPLLKNKQEETIQPIFTDVIEFNKFNKEKKLKAISIPFVDLLQFLLKDSKGFILNPQGFHIILTKELLAGLYKRFNIMPRGLKPAAPSAAAPAGGANAAAPKAEPAPEKKTEE